MENKEAKNLIKKYLNHTATPEERDLVERWYIQAALEQEMPDTSPDFPGIETEMFKALLAKQQGNTKKLWPKLTAISVAAIVFIASLVTLWYRADHPLPSRYTNDVPAGGNKALLTLQNGQTINLTDLKNGQIAQQSGIQIIKTTDGQLVYKSVENKIPLINASSNTISTPKGGQYQLILPDGTKVWLNAGSKLNYPVSFKGRRDREVDLSGEAYFEVKKDKEQPFIVKSAHQQIKVLGTHFNISAYPEDADVKTTLLEGSVEVNAKTILKPGEQSVLSHDQIRVEQVDTEISVAWKNGDFMFKNEPLENIMQKIARWYNVDVIYADQLVSKKKFGGTISKFKNVSEVLCMLELTEEVHFKIEGRRITVLSKK